ncbi:hypothetical protein BH24ACT15_BH24ACT15_09680 [soil metagenome]
MTVYREMSHSSHTRGRPLSVRHVVPLLVGVGVVIVVGLSLVAVNVVARSRAETIVEREVAAVLDAPVQARIGGRLSGLKVLLGRIDRLDLQATDVPLPDSAAAIDVITAELVDVRLTDQQPSGGQGTFDAVLSQEQVRRAVPVDLAPLISLSPDALVVDLGFTSFPLRPTVAEGSLRFVPIDDLGPLVEGLITGVGTIPLQLPPGVVLQDAAVVDGGLRLTGTVDAAEVAGQ